MIRERIKSETQTSHQSLENISYSREMAMGQLSPEMYKELILFNYKTNKSFEELWNELPFSVPETLMLNQRSKLAYLENDLKTIGLAVTQEQEKWSLEYKEYHQFLGALYVIEGSTLGGSVINKMLNKNDKLQAFQPYSFYNGYGDKTGMMWKIFLDHLTQIEDPTKVDECIDAAKQCFNYMELQMLKIRGSFVQAQV